MGHFYAIPDVVAVAADRLVAIVRVDEVHHLLAGTVREQRQSLNQLKFLSNELRMPVIAIGTSEALYAMQADPQIASRFEPFAFDTTCMCTR